MARIVLLVPATTYRVADFLAAAGDLSLDVVVATDGAPPAEGRPGEDDAARRVLAVDLTSPEAVAEAVVALDRRLPIDAVLSVDDGGVEAAALAAHRLGLPHASPQAVADARDKLRMRRRLDGAEVPQPAFRAVAAGDPDALRRAGADVGYPCVVKPTTLSASRGVIRADDEAGLLAAAARAEGIARASGEPPQRPLLVEAFVPGPEVAVEAVVTDDRLRVLAIFDKPDPLDGPYFEETIYVTPSRLPAADQRAVVAATSAACRALGLDTGPVHAELRVHGGRAQVIEVAPRTIGGLCGRTVELATGRRLEALVLANALGRSLPPGPRHRGAGVLMVPAPGAGRFVRLHGKAAALSEPGIRSVDVTVTPGTPVAPAPDGGRYLAFVLAVGLTAADAEAALRRAWRHLRVELEPAPTTPEEGDCRQDVHGT